MLGDDDNEAKYYCDLLAKRANIEDFGKGKQDKLIKKGILYTIALFICYKYYKKSIGDTTTETEEDTTDTFEEDMIED